MTAKGTEKPLATTWPALDGGPFFYAIHPIGCESGIPAGASKESIQ